MKLITDEVYDAKILKKKLKKGTNISLLLNFFQVCDYFWKLKLANSPKDAVTKSGRRKKELMVVSVETIALSQNCFTEFCLSKWNVLNVRSFIFWVYCRLSDEFNEHLSGDQTFEPIESWLIVLGNINPFSVFELSFNCLLIREGNFEITQRYGRPKAGSYLLISSRSFLIFQFWRQLHSQNIFLFVSCWSKEELSQPLQLKRW